MLALPPADIISWLNTNQGAATAVLTAVLIIVTIYYAFATGQMVGEMRRAREVTLLPKLAVELHHIGPMHVDALIKNVGPGAAFGVDVTLIYDASKPERASLERRWRRNVIASGEQFEFLPPRDAMDFRALAAEYTSIRLIGTMRDAFGKQHKVDEELRDIGEWQQLLEKAVVRWVQEPDERLAKELGDRLDRSARDSTRDLTRSLERIVGQLRELGQPPTENRTATPSEKPG